MQHSTSGNFTSMKGMNPIPSGSTIGILGGGQLGRMLSLSAKAMGFRVVVLDPTPDSPCGQVADEQIVASYTDLRAAQRLAEMSDVVTYEFENVDADVAETLTRWTLVPQGAMLLQTTQHRLREKDALVAAGVKVAPYLPVWDGPSLHAAVTQIGLPAVLKSTRGGYDGKGQRVLRAETDVEQAAAELQESVAAQAETPLAPFVLEGFVPFVQELSVVVARSVNGDMETFPVAENRHVNGILHTSSAPARILPQIQDEAACMAKQVAASLGAVGLLAVEMFLTGDGTLYVNELAPRPHNSGHYTMDACETSQFEQHLRAVCGWTLAKPRLTSPVVMVNVLGQHMERVVERAPHWPAHVKVHLYGKHEAKPGRKMGHVNILAADVEEALATMRELGVWEETSHD